MKTIQTPIKFKTEYIAIDGFKWNNKRQCEEYEQLLADASPLKELSFFDYKGNKLDVFALRKIPTFCYLVLKHDIKSFDAKVVKKIICKDAFGELNSYQIPTRKGIWFNNWSNCLNGSYGSNGWEVCSTISELERQIQGLQEKIELFKKIGVDK